MAGFDLSTAKPVAPAGFDLSTARPVSEGMPMPRRSWSDVGGEALANAPESAGKFVSGIVQSLAHPIDTLTSISDLAAGGFYNAMPKAVQSAINAIEINPDAQQRAIKTANAVGGEYQQRYGDMDKIKATLATDPVGAAADLSTLISGGATATARFAPSVSKVMASAAKIINPMTPATEAVNYGLGLGAKGASNVVDAVVGQRAANRAGNIVRNALTEEGRAPQNLAAAQNALANAQPGMTVRQSLADVMSPQIQYLGETVQAKTAPGRKLSIDQAQEADRMARLQGITPDLQSAEAMRGNVSSPLYIAATQPTTSINVLPLTQQIDGLLAENPGNTKLVSALNQVKNGLEASTNAQQVSSVLDNLKDLISSKDNKFIVKNLTNIKSTIEQQLPGYQKAQQVFAAASPPVNQAKVLGAMQEVLAQPLGTGERAGPFMTALGRGENALIKKSTGAARYDDLSQMLSPQQMGVVNGIESELKRNAEVVRQTQAGADAMRIILEANQSKFRLPSFLNIKITLTNEVLDILKDKMSANVLKELEKGFESAKDFQTLLKKVPASQRIDVLRALGQANLSPGKMRNIGVINALAPESENQNALIGQ